MDWDGASVAMKIFPETPSASEPTIAEQLFYETIEEDLDINDDAYAFDPNFESSSTDNHNTGYKSKTIKDSNYGKVDIDSVIQQCKHLPQHQQNDLKEVYGTILNIVRRRTKNLH